MSRPEQLHEHCRYYIDTYNWYRWLSILSTYRNVIDNAQLVYFNFSEFALLRFSEFSGCQSTEFIFCWGLKNSEFKLKFEIFMEKITHKFIFLKQNYVKNSFLVLFLIKFNETRECQQRIKFSPNPACLFSLGLACLRKLKAQYLDQLTIF